MRPLRGAPRGPTAKVGWILALSFGIGACHYTPTGPVQREAQVIEDITYDSTLNVDLAAMTKLPEGVYVQDLVDGTGDTIAANDQLAMGVTLWLHDGTQMGSGSGVWSVSSTCTTNCIIPGLAIGIPGMLEGGTRRIIIPPDLGYGLYDSYGADGSVLPGGSVLIFEIVADSIV